MKNFIAGLFLLVSSVASAQVPSSQCHLLARGVNNNYPMSMTDSQVAEIIKSTAPSPELGAPQPNPGLLAQSAAHTHVDWEGGKVITGPTRIPFSVLLHKTAGVLYYLYPGVMHSEFFGNVGYPDRDSIIWDGGGQTWLPADPTGDPDGVKTWSGSFVLTPPIPHGWFTAVIQVATVYANGKSGINYAERNFYSNVDPSAPEYTGDMAWGREFARTICMFSQIHETLADGSDLLVDAGEQTIEVEATPKAPFSTPFTGLEASVTGYANQQLSQNSVNEQRIDADFHHGVQGTTVVSLPGDSTSGNQVAFEVQLDPAVMGPGAHKVQIIRWQASPMNTNQWATLLVFPVTVGDDVPPPPPPPPVEAWAPVPLQVIVKEFGTQDQFKICIVTPFGERCIGVQ